MADEPNRGLALELERLRGTLGEGLAEIKGSLALLVHRTDRVDQELADQRTTLTALESRVDGAESAISAQGDHPARLAAVERLVWIGVGAAAVLGTVGGWVAGALI
ncbi:hypothetical protein [Streptomyces sp. NPDC052179]|uniref:hypothetical protein n=1 Tax=Streptomyces sp. NPDC052179 TaxID=3155680 RepID=UPI0034341105